MTSEFPALHKAAFEGALFDNHAHNLLREDHKDEKHFESIFSEADGAALEDAVLSIPCMRVTRTLAKLYGLPQSATWVDIKETRKGMDYLTLCKMCFDQCGIERILLDDGLPTLDTVAEGYKWHDQFTTFPTKRLVRVEKLAETILAQLFHAPDTGDISDVAKQFMEAFERELGVVGEDPEVVGFKSVVCYRSGLDVGQVAWVDIPGGIGFLHEQYKATDKIRVKHKAVNDYLVNMTMDVAARHKKPVQFHTGLGDSDIILALSSPAHLQPLIRAYPNTTVVLLHGSYPYTREAGYLASVYPNVYLDFGEFLARVMTDALSFAIFEVFPRISADGQRNVIRQMLELTPTNKIMWSTDAIWWPESFYLGVVDARAAIYAVLSSLVKQGEITEEEAVEIVDRVFRENGRRVYSLT